MAFDGHCNFVCFLLYFLISYLLFIIIFFLGEVYDRVRALLSDAHDPARGGFDSAALQLLCH